MNNRSRTSALVLQAALGALTLTLPSTTSAFTQSGLGTEVGHVVPMGHEWLTRFAGLELLKMDPVIKPDPNDPRKAWTRGLAKNTDLSATSAMLEVRRIQTRPVADSRYTSTFSPILDAILGQRWVDIGGFNVTKAKLGGINCHDAVTQQPADIQYDHYMRRYDDREAEGGIQAAERSQERFVQYFVDAAMAPQGVIAAWDGGGYSAPVVADRNYFLFGRALHLFQDSFSPDHTVRAPEDNYETVIQVKSYLCAAGSEMHSHSIRSVLDYSAGDVVWKVGTRFPGGWVGYAPSNMKDLALVATEATKDLWAAFIRTMGRPVNEREQVARSEATKLSETWLRIDKERARTWYSDEAHRDGTYILATGQAGKGQTVSACLKGIGVPSGDQLARVKELDEQRRICLYNIVDAHGFSDQHDRALRMPYHWAWRDPVKWKTPPSDWTIPVIPVERERKVRIRSALNGQFLTAPSGAHKNAWLYAAAGAPLEFVQVGDANSAVFRLTSVPLFLSYRARDGAVKLYDSAYEADYRVEDLGGNQQALRNLRWNNYIWLYNDSPYITSAGNPDRVDSRWEITQVP